MSRLTLFDLPHDGNMLEPETGIDQSDKVGFVILKSRDLTLRYPEQATSLLEALEHYGIAIEYQCRSGYCGSCRCKIAQGEVSYSQQPLALINDGEILPCCCIPDGDIELDM